MSGVLIARLVAAGFITAEEGAALMFAETRAKRAELLGVLSFGGMMLVLVVDVLEDAGFFR